LVSDTIGVQFVYFSTGITDGNRGAPPLWSYLPQTPESYEHPCVCFFEHFFIVHLGWEGLRLLHYF
jgi:hypothetical protein